MSNKSNYRQSLLPYMGDYDRFVSRTKTRWLPYLMYFHNANYRSPVVNTDEYGFRLTHMQDGVVGLRRREEQAYPTNLLVGGSTVFGVGASNDSHTLSSNLNALTKIGDPEWINFGARGYNSVQELMLFMFHKEHFRDIHNIVIFSGLNNLVLAGFSSPDEVGLPPFFFSGDFFTHMKRLNDKHAVKQMSVLKRIKHKIHPPEGNKKKLADGENVAFRLEVAVKDTIRDLRTWKILTDSMGINLVFCLQPLATWINRKQSQEEDVLFTELKNNPSNFWRSFSPILDREVGEAYSQRLEKECRKMDITYADSNKLLEKTESVLDRWLFVDRAHFNDFGYQVMAEQLFKFLNPQEINSER